MASSSSAEVILHDLLALERAAFAYHDGDENPFDSYTGAARHAVLRRVRWRRAYELYLRSEAWADLRAAVLERAERHCERCPAGTGLFPVDLEIHHLTYLRIGDEALEDLVALCRPCHEHAERQRRQHRLHR